MNTVFLLLLITACIGAERTIYAPPAYAPTENQKLHEVADMLKGQPETAEQKQGLVHLLHATLHMNIPPSYLENGQMISELIPPVKIVVSQNTKARVVPHRDAQVTRKIVAGSTLVAIATTPDMLWVQVGKNEFIPTKDADLQELLKREAPEVTKLSPPLPVHVKADVTVRKYPDIGGKPVAQLRKGELITAEAVTNDYAWLMIGPNQFIPTMSAKLGDPTTRLSPPLTVHMRRDSIVRETPSPTGKPVTVLHESDIMQAIAVSTDLQWLKVAHHSYISANDAKLGIPPPPVIEFPRKVPIRLLKDAQVVKNPHYPNAVIRWLKKDDTLFATGSTADLKWLRVAHKRYIPLDSAALVTKDDANKPIPMNPAVPVKVVKLTPARSHPRADGRILMYVRKGDKYFADAVSEDFMWVRIHSLDASIRSDLWIPLTSAYLSSPQPRVTALVPPLRLRALGDAKVHKTPNDASKVVRILGESDYVQGYAISEDKKWYKIGEKEYVSIHDVKKEAEDTNTVPIFPPLKVVVTSDTTVTKEPSETALPVRRLMRGEVLEIYESSKNLKWLKLNDNEYIPTANTAHVTHTTPLTPPVRVIVAADNLKVRNVPLFAGMPMKTLTKGETYDTIGVTPDLRWLQIAKDQFIPASGCVLHESEGNDMPVVLKIRSTNVVKDPVLVNTDAHENKDARAQSVTTSHLAGMLEKAFENQISRAAIPPKEAKPTTSIDFDGKGQKLRITKDTLVMSEPSPTAMPVRGIPRGTIVDAIGLGSSLTWVKINDDEFVELSATEPLQQ